MAGYGPAIVTLALLESILPQLVQTAESALQSVVALITMVAVASLRGSMVISRRLLRALPCGSVRRT